MMASPGLIIVIVDFFGITDCAIFLVAAASIHTLCFVLLFYKLQRICFDYTGCKIINTDSP